jgi:hypothetical protein
MTVPAVNIVIEKGTSFEAIYNVTNSDNSVYSLTNQSATAKIRKHPTATSSKSFTTTVTVATGEIVISMGSTNTADLAVGRNYYDVILTHSSTGKIIKIFEGIALVKDTVSI